MTILVALALAAGQPSTEPLTLSPTWARVVRDPYRLGSRETVDIGTITGPQPMDVHFWLRRSSGEGRTDKIEWTTTLACPRSREAILAMEGLTAAPDVPGLGAGPTDVMLDGVGYSLDAPVRIGKGGSRFRVKSNLFTPLADWADALLKTAAPCWTSHVPGDASYIAPPTTPLPE